MWFSTHLTTVSVSTWKSPTGSLTGQWYHSISCSHSPYCLNLHAFLLAPSQSFCFASCTCSTNSSHTRQLANTGHTIPSHFTIFSAIYSLSQNVVPLHLYLHRESLIMRHLKCTFAVKSFPIPVVRIKICPLCWPSILLCSQFYWEAVCKSWYPPVSLEVMLLDRNLLFFFFSLSPNNVDFIKC